MIQLLPNILSFFRLASSLVLIPLILGNNFKAALFLFAAAAISDFLDGYIARKFSVSSEFGAMLDPLADKALMLTSYALFAHAKLIPIFVALVVIARDLLILLVVALCKIHGIKLQMQPLLSSKINTTIQLIFITLILGCNVLLINIEYLTEVGAALVVFFTIFSGAEYVQKYYWIKHKAFSR
jgi:cardiolipin synthase